MTVLDELSESIIEFRDARGWASDHTPANLAEAISVEAAELQRPFLWGPTWGEGPTREEVADELADIWIFSLIMAYELGIDVEEAIRGKLEKNGEKYPVQHHDDQGGLP